MKVHLVGFVKQFIIMHGQYNILKSPNLFMNIVVGQLTLTRVLVQLHLLLKHGRHYYHQENSSPIFCLKISSFHTRALN